MNRLPFDYVNKEVDKLYMKEIDLNDAKAISDHVSFIKAFLEASGWSEESYIEALFNFTPLKSMN